MRFGDIYFHSPNRSFFVVALLEGINLYGKPSRQVLPMLMDSGAAMTTITRNYLEYLFTSIDKQPQNAIGVVGGFKSLEVKSDFKIYFQFFCPINNFYYSYPFDVEDIGGIVESGDPMDSFIEVYYPGHPPDQIFEFKSKDCPEYKQAKDFLNKKEMFHFKERSLLGRDILNILGVEVYFNVKEGLMELVRPIHPGEEVVRVDEYRYPHPTKLSLEDPSLFVPVMWR